MRWLDLSRTRGISSRYHLVDDQLNLLAILLFNTVTYVGIYRIVTNERRNKLIGKSEIEYILAHPEEWYMESLL